jgi:hypothetical protein
LNGAKKKYGTKLYCIEDTNLRGDKPYHQA